MKKSTIIANCLVNSRMIEKLEDAEFTVRRIFETEFPQSNLLIWNAQVNDRVAQHIIDSVGSASRINVRKFIEDLSNSDSPLH
jgi:hypothetical protein